jgi:hypothetical protein
MDYPGPGPHDTLVSGPEGALGWCRIDQMYCGGTNLAGGTIICTCCAAAGGFGAASHEGTGTTPPASSGQQAGSATGAPSQLPGDGQGDPALSDPPIGGARPDQTITTPEQAQATDPAVATPPDPAWG